MPVAYEVLDYISQKLGIKPGETTQDQIFTLNEVECLAAAELLP
jgi:NADH-quinone oxidoreductase subunit E